LWVCCVCWVRLSSTFWLCRPISVGGGRSPWRCGGGGGGNGQGQGNNLFDFQVSCPGHQHDQALEHYTSVQVTAQVCDYLLLPILKTIDHDPKSKKENVE
jgi:hypothetical protein